MYSQDLVGRVLMTSRERVDPWRLGLFSRVTGQTDPVYLDDAAARAAGYRGIVAPPTFILALELEQQNPRDLAKLAGFDPARVLHAEQGFEYEEVVCAGDELAFEARLTDIYEKKGGALTFFVRRTSVTLAGNRVPIAAIRRTIVVRS